jgi:hypothetical protein
METYSNTEWARIEKTFVEDDAKHGIMDNQNINKDTFNEIEIDKINYINEYDIFGGERENFYLYLKRYYNCVIKLLHETFLYQDFIPNSTINLLTLFSAPIRHVSLDENYNNLKNIFKKNKDLVDTGNTYGISEDNIFWIINMRYNYNILKKLFPCEIPDSKFALVHLAGFEEPKFAVIQKIINGITLWDLYNNEDEFKRRRPYIKNKIKKFIYCKYIDLNIKNFIITDKNEVYYIESKPTYLSAKYANKINRRGIKEVLL